jgi:hypothetical protein
MLSPLSFFLYPFSFFQHPEIINFFALSSCHSDKMAAAKGGGKEPANIVHQQAILVETIHKEERHQKLFTTYSINPFRKSMHLLCLYSEELLRIVK